MSERVYRADSTSRPTSCPEGAMNPTRASGESPADVLTSPLLPEHRAAGAAMTTFAGWQMPLRYRSDLAEHHAVRTSAGLFDLSHMAQIDVSGPGAGRALDRAVVSRASTLAPGRARYTMLCRADGGVLDDVIVYRLTTTDYLVIANAANRLVVRDELTARAGTEPATVVDRTPHRALIAIQGPASAAVLGRLTSADLAGVRRYGVTTGEVADVPAVIARTGYTGEDGFELSVPATTAVTVWRALVAAGAPEVAPCGLACRDTLRLEAGMPLYGHELTAEVTPFDAGLGRVVDLDPGHAFVGREALARRATQEGGRALVGLTGSGRRAARAGYGVFAGAQQVGHVTSGALSPTLGRPVALAYVDPSQARPGTEVDVDVRGHRLAMEVVPLPFYRRDRPADRPA